MWVDHSKSIPVLERWWKQLRHAAWWMNQCVVNGKRPPAVYVWPEMPSKRSALFKMTRALGWELTNRPRRQALFGIRFEDITHKQSLQIPEEFGTHLRWWNIRCNDISKLAVERHHADAFGYGMAVDPLTHTGRMVCKSDLNAMHDGQIMEGPLREEELLPSAVYQRVIDNTDEQGRYFDFRVVYIRGTLPVVYQKFKDPAQRFTNETVHVDLLDHHPFSPDECDAMVALATNMGVDYAEFDALRDRSSGQLFVVDINPTPWGPPAQLAPASQAIAIQKMAHALQARLQ